MANRNRTNPVQFYLSDDEQYILNTKFKASGMKSMSAFLRNTKTTAPTILLTRKPRTRTLISADMRARSSSMAAQDGCLSRQASS